MYGCESWTLKKAEQWRIDPFELWCWRRLLKVPWTARRSKSEVTQSCLTLCNSMDCSTQGFPAYHQPLDLAQTHVHWVSWWHHPTISSSVIPFSSCLQSFPESGSFPMIWFFTSCGQSIGVSASALVLPMNIQDWFSLNGLAGSPCSPRDSQESSPTPQFKSISSSALTLLRG